jgi:predicted acetyltransferase
VELDDVLVPQVRGPWRLVAEDGKGRLEPSSVAAVLLRARAVGPLLTGFLPAQSLALGGLARGDDASLARLTAIFAAPRPSFLDFF